MVQYDRIHLKNGVQPQFNYSKCTGLLQFILFFFPSLKCTRGKTSFAVSPCTELADTAGRMIQVDLQASGLCVAHREPGLLAAGSTGAVQAGRCSWQSSEASWGICKASAKGSFHCDLLKGCVTTSYLLPACIVGFCLTWAPSGCGNLSITMK